MSCKRFALPVAAGVCLLLLPVAAWAQSSIGGVVRDASGGVLPGVTVEAASPALIEEVRVAVTDGQGLYLIVNLRPGPYTVSFSLPGFSTFVRDGLDLPAQFTATVDADMTLGQLEETITVTGEAPLVDIRSSGGQVQLEQETLDAIPGTGRISTLQILIPGANLNRATDRSVGGTNDRPQTNWSLHGAPSSRPVVDGMNYQLNRLSQGVVVYNQAAIQEVVVETAGIGADRDTGGLQLNLIMKEGSNQFSGSGSYSFLGDGWWPSHEANNFSDDLMARGLNPDRMGSLKKWRDSSLSLGGPLVQDKVWFFAAAREGVTQLYSEFAYFNKVNQPESFLYIPDTSRPGFTNEYAKDLTLRLTWQAADRHKFTASVFVQPNCNCYYSLLHATQPRSPKATGDHNYNPNWIPTASWTFPATNRLLVEAGVSAQRHDQRDEVSEHSSMGAFAQKPGDIRIMEQSPRIWYGAVNLRYLPRRQTQGRFTVTYVTGSHNFKTGLLYRYMERGDVKTLGQDPLMYGSNAMNYRFNKGVPNQVTLLDAPWNFEESVRDLAFFVQDQWTIDRLTVNMGLRMNNAVGSAPAQTLGAGPWVGSRTLAAVTNVPNFTNLSPRVGAAYDLTGTGRTAVKFSLGRYPGQTDQAVWNPAFNLSRTTSRTWTDSNGDFKPDCEMLNPKPNGECGKWSDLNFGKARAGTNYAKDATEGFNVQAHHWEASVSTQTELTEGVSLDVGYFRTWYGGFLTTVNTSVSAGDFDPFCVTAPTNPELGANSGKQICGLYDVKPEFYGQRRLLRTRASNYGDQSQVFNGVDMTLNARFLEGGLLSGGVSVGRTVHDTCWASDKPQIAGLIDMAAEYGNFTSALPGYCNIKASWGDSTQAKFMAIYPLPYDISISAIYQNVPGVPIESILRANNKMIKPSLGRNLAAGARGSVNVPLIPKLSMYEPRSTQLDIRFAKTFRLGGTSLRGNFDVFNITNSNDVLRMVTRYGGSWKNVQQILGGRLMKFSVRVDF